MARSSTYPTLYDECLKFDISFLKRHGYLQPGNLKSGFCSWSRNNDKIGSIGFKVSTIDEPYIELNYQSNGTPIKTRIILVAIPSNIRNGKIWYFICPTTGKRCRKLYLNNGYFTHREAFTGMYKIQTESHISRQITQKYKPMYAGNEYDQLQAKHFTPYYNDKPTKRYTRIIEKIKKAEAMPDLLLDKFKLK